MQPNGQLRQVDFMDNVGGINLTDSVFKIAQNQAAGGINFDYILTGGIRKRLGAPKINSVADTALYALGIGEYAPISGTSKSVFRAAGMQLQLFDTSVPSFTSIGSDQASPSFTPFANGSVIDVQFTQFSMGTSDILWGAGGGAALPVGAYSTSKYTVNGVAPATGTFTAVKHTLGGSWSVGNVGLFRYAIAYHKASTGALSNAALDASATTTTITDNVVLSWDAVPDQTLIDQVWIYRSALAGVSGFTTGSLIAKVASSTTTFTDKGDIGNPDLLSAQNVPRIANTVLDYSPLPTGTYQSMTLWGHRLVTASGNTLYISGVNLSEAWPLTNYIVVPSAGPITALSTVSFTSPQANSLQELLVVFKEKEVWVLTPGTSNDYTTWALLKVDDVGCINQSLVVRANGFLAWVTWRGIYLWDGTSKPIYASRLLEPLFGTDGDIDKSLFTEGCSAFFRRENQITWYLSSKTYGTQKFAIKMDVRLTMLQIEQNLTGRVIDGVFIQDVHTFPVYTAATILPLGGSNEQLILGDNAGFCYYASNGTSDGGADYNFRYLSAPLHCGNPNVRKQFHSVVAWVQDAGNWNLYLDYWPDFITDTNLQTTIGLQVSTENQSAALYDIATYDISYYDAYYPDLVPLVFNLQAGNANSAQGSAIQLQFRNDTADQPIVIHGYSLIYSDLGGVNG